MSNRKQRKQRKQPQTNSNQSKTFTAQDLKAAQKKAHKRGFDAASRSNRLSNWRTSTTDSDAEVRGNIQIMRNRYRDLMRNNAWATRAIQVIKSNTVGSGILPQFATKRTQTRWEQWGDTTACDHDGRHDFYGIQQLVIGTVAAVGDCLVVRRRTNKTPLGLTIQVLEPEYLDITKEGPTKGGGMIFNGIEYNADGQRVGYWLYENHPGQAFGYRHTSKFMPEKDVIHIYRQDRPGQSIGYPWGASVMTKMRDLADWQDNKLYRAKIAACFTAFVYDSLPGGPTEENGDLITQLEPGNVEYLPPGKQVAFASPPSAGGEESYNSDILREIAAGFGITAESLTGDLSGVNFSSGRMGWIEMQRNIDSWRWTMLIPILCEGVAKWFQEQLYLKDDIRETAVTWTPPRREMIDPAKELKAYKEAIRNGFLSLSEVIRTLGYDPTVTLTELSNDFDLLDSLGLVLDTDPRQDAKRITALSSEDQEVTQEDETENQNEKA